MASEASGLDFLVRWDDFRVTRTDPADASPEIAEGEALLAVDRFAFTANNITYAAIGEQLGYWKFFPAPEGWGRIPVWGYGDVLRSRAPGAPEGLRVFGYFPMSSVLVVRPERAGPAGFDDGAPHRAALPPVYNRYASTAANPIYDPAREDQEMILFPLFMTAFVLDDYLADNGFFRGEVVVLSSASSKTALGTATLLSQRTGARPTVVGLTSPGNVGFVEKLGCYDRVLPYDAVASLSAEAPAVFVDFSGNRDVVRGAHEALGTGLSESILVGATHWEKTGSGAPRPGPSPSLFFAPAQIQKRSAEWGAAGVRERFAEAWRDLVARSDGWLHVVRGRGAEAVEKVYRDTLEGRVPPDEGHVLSLRP